MSSCTQPLFEQFPTLGAILTGVIRWNGNCRHTEYLAHRLQPLRECRPRQIRDRRRPLAVGNHRGKQQLSRGSPVARLDLALNPFHRPDLNHSAAFEVFSPVPALSGLQGRSSIQSNPPKTRFLAQSQLLQIVSRNRASIPDFTPRQGLIFKPFLGWGKLKKKGFERLRPPIRVQQIFNSLTRGEGVAIIPDHLEPKARNRWQPLGAAIRVETGVKLIIEPLGSRKFGGEDRTLGAQFGVISLVVFETGSDATMADPSWRGPFSLKFCLQDP